MSLKIEDLHVNVNKKEVLKGINLEVNINEVHAIMGPNGSGKSSLALSLLGHPSYFIKKGRITLDGNDITNLKPNERAKLGLFLGFQYPLEIPGLSLFTFLKSCYENLKGKVGFFEFKKIAESKLKLLKLDEEFLERSLNDGFSGGEKKKCEILQLCILEPKYAILDETDSGLDIDSLKLVAKTIKEVFNSKIGLILITHYQRILKYVRPDFVHIMIDGRIVKSGNYKIAEEIEEVGYEALKNDNK